MYISGESSPLVAGSVAAVGVLPCSFDDTLLPLEYPTVVFESAAAAVLRIDEGLVGVLVFLSPSSDDVTLGFGIGAGRDRVTDGCVPERAEAASRDLMVEMLLVCLALFVLALVRRWVVGLEGPCIRDCSILSLPLESWKPIFSTCFIIISSTSLSQAIESFWNFRSRFVRPSGPISLSPYTLSNPNAMFLGWNWGNVVS